MPTCPASKKATNLSIRSDLLYEAKALKINLSQAFETHLAELVKAKKLKPDGICNPVRSVLCFGGCFDCCT